MGNAFSWIRSRIVKDDIEFVDTTRLAYISSPIVPAKSVPTHFSTNQKETYGQYKFAFCPGMHDYATVGYIIPAWEDFHIKTNKAGSTALQVGRLSQSKFEPPNRMDNQVVDGVFELQDGIGLHVWKFNSPWGIFVNKNISCFLMPAFYHAKYLDNVYVYPGIVDYGKRFHSSNFICALKRDCEVHIKQGDPLLHVIPFYNSSISGSSRPAESEDMDSFRTTIYNNDKNFYRKYLQIKKRFTLNK